MSKAIGVLAGSRSEDGIAFEDNEEKRKGVMYRRCLPLVFTLAICLTSSANAGYDITLD